MHANRQQFYVFRSVNGSYLQQGFHPQSIHQKNQDYSTKIYSVHKRQQEYTSYTYNLKNTDKPNTSYVQVFTALKNNLPITYLTYQTSLLTEKDQRIESLELGFLLLLERERESSRDESRFQNDPSLPSSLIYKGARDLSRRMRSKR